MTGTKEIFSKYWHFILWPIIFIITSIQPMRFGEVGLLQQTLMGTIFIMIITYVNIYVLHPRFSNGLGNLAYIALSLIIVVGFVAISTWADCSYFYPKYIAPLLKHDFKPISPIMRYSTTYILTLFICNTYIMNLRRQKGVEMYLKMHKEKTDMELKFLKSQVNPHFLFNALNSVYTKVYMKESDAAESVLKLSDIFRYVLDDCASERISLAKEIHYLDNYIDFQLMKTDEDVNFEFTKDVSNDTIQIAPLLFMPFIENCFKHSRLGYIDNSFVKISLKEKEGEIHFEAQNSVPTSNAFGQEKSDRKGVGLVNVKKQLDMLYPDQYKINIQSNDSIYWVQLTLSVKE